MTHAEEIAGAVSSLIEKGCLPFRRVDVRDELGLSHDEWMSGYTAIFQGMRIDHPGGAPEVASKYKDVFKRVNRGKYVLTEKGKKIILDSDKTRACARAGLVDFANKMLSMRKITMNNLINTYWGFENEIKKSGKMGFVIHGNIQWESTSDWINCPDGTLLKSNLYDPVGKHIQDRPVRNYLQRHMNIYEICGLIPTDINGKDAASTEPILIDNIKRINFITNSLSFLYGASLEWYPAVYRKARQINIEPPPKKEETEKWVLFPISRSQAESTSTIIQDKDVKLMFQPFTQMIDRIPDDKGNFKEIIKTAISWHSFGNRFTSGLYSFNSYWSSFELIANWFYNISEKMPKKDKKEAIMRIIGEEITWKNCLPKIRKCYEIINPTAKMKLKELLKNLPEGDAIKETIFSRDNVAGKSLFDLRNAVAHGKISDDHLRLKGHMQAMLHSARIASKRTILGAIQYHQVSSRNI